MKPSSLFFCIFFSTALAAQEKPETYSAFVLLDKEVMWVQVYHAQQSRDVLSQHVRDFLVRKPWIRELHYDGTDLVADVVNLRVDYKRYGGKYTNTSNLIRTGRWSGKVRISFKDGKYRVIVYGLEYDARQPAMHAGKMSNQAHPIHGSWTDWVLNRYRTHFRKSRHINMDLMHLQLKDSFTLSEIDVIDNEW